MNFQIQHNMLTGLLEAAATNDVRTYLNGVCLEASGTEKIVGIATDGHMLAVAWEDQEPPENFTKILIPRDAIKRLPKRGPTDHVTVTIDGDNASLEYEGTASMFKISDDRYPDWRAVTPTKLVHQTQSQFNPTLLWRAQKTLGKLGGLTPARIKRLVTWTDYSDAGTYASAVMRSADVRDAFVVVQSWAHTDRGGSDRLYVPVKGGK